MWYAVRIFELLMLATIADEPVLGALSGSSVHLEVLDPEWLETLCLQEVVR